MIIVSEKYKLIDLEIDGNMRTLPINPSEAWNVIECQLEDGTTIKVNEGDKITFITTTSGEIKKGLLTKIAGGKKNIELEIIPEGVEYKEIWESNVIMDNSLKVINDERVEE